MTQAKDLDVSDIGRLVKFATDRKVFEGVAYGSDAVVIGRLEAIEHRVEDTGLTVAGRLHHVKLEEDVEVHSGNIVIDSISGKDKDLLAHTIKDAVFRITGSKKKEEDTNG